MLLLATFLFAGAIALSGCGGGGSSSPTISGTAQGGLSPISGATVILYAADSSSPLGTTTTNSSGNFTISYTPPSSPALLFVHVKGGNAGEGTNTQIGLDAAVGPSNNPSTSVTVNEFTTAAFVSFIGSDMPPIPSALINYSNNHYEDYVALISGQPQSSPPNTTYLQDLEMMANAGASCVQSGTGSTSCTDLAIYTGTTTTLPAVCTMLRTGVVNADLNNGKVNFSGFYALASGVSSKTGWTNMPSTAPSLGNIPVGNIPPAGSSACPM